MAEGEAMRIEEPGMLQSMGSQRVGHDLVTEKQQIVYLQYVSAV